MRPVVSIVISMAAALWVLPLAWADIFEWRRPEDGMLRKLMRDDRGQSYIMTPGVLYEPHEELVSQVRRLGVDGLVRQAGLQDTETAFDKYLRKELMSGKINRGDLALSHPLMLLEYSSPVMADVIKHYRISAHMRLAMEQARLQAIEQAAGRRSDRLGQQSVRACLELHADKGLVEAMRMCMRRRAPFDAMGSLDGKYSLQDGRRRIHVLEQALERLGLDKSRVAAIVALSGDQAIKDDGLEDIFPKKNFNVLLQEERQALTRLWHEALDKHRAAGRVPVAMMEKLSLPGVPVTVRTMADLAMLDDDRRGMHIVQLSFAQALCIMLDLYRRAAACLGLALNDPLLPREFLAIVDEKKTFLENVVAGHPDGIMATASYKELLAVLARAADNARVHMQESGLVQFSDAELRAKALMLQY